MKPERCDLTKNCTLVKGHEGPCAVKPGRWSRFVDGLGEAIGEALFGGNR